jgi:hypothetical protein
MNLAMTEPGMIADDPNTNNLRDVAALLAPDRPLLITDADEVLFAFMAAFERHLHANDTYFNWASYRLNGNIIARADETAVDNPQVKALIADFFEQHTRTIEPLEGAAEAMAALVAERGLQIVVLSNVPAPRHGDRQWALARHGMDYPLIANEGAKGRAVAFLAARTNAPVFFIDDAPSHHDDVAVHAGHVRRIHYVGHPRLAELIGPAEASHLRARSWDDIRRFIEDHLDDTAT